MMCWPFYPLRGDTVVETKATLEVVRTRVKRVHTYFGSGQNKSKVCPYILWKWSEQE